MSLYLNTHGKSVASVAICGRCSFKFPYVDLSADRNAPGLRVCRDCNDEFDPWRLSPREPENITLQFPRPDEPLTA